MINPEKLSSLFHRQFTELPLLMGILNVTPDSFSDGGLFLSTEAAVEQAKKLASDGADIIDIGGESTRPGSERIAYDEEIIRTIPVIKAVREELPNIKISIDTYKASVAEEAIKAGVDIVNDISGASLDPSILEVVSLYNITYILMHIKGNPGNMQQNPHYDDVMGEINSYFYEKISLLKEKGISKVIIDPGFGFGKRVSDNYTILRSLNEFNQFDTPLLVGVSRKSFIGKVTEAGIADRDYPSLALELFAITNGASIIRTHNVKKLKDSIKVLEMIYQTSGKNSDV